MRIYYTAFCLDDPRKSLFCMSNTWGDRSQNIAVCESLMLREIERAKQLVLIATVHLFPYRTQKLSSHSALRYLASCLGK